MSTAAVVTDGAGVRVGQRRVPFSNLDKKLYPSGFTKRDVLEYYRRIAPRILPHLKGRPVTLKRYPNGSAQPFFYEKNCPTHRPPWLRTARMPGRSGDGPEHCLINDPAALLWAANLASLELHVTMAKATAPDRPIAMVFDLDPGPPAGMADCVRLGLKLRDMLADLGLRSFAKSSGGKGLHLYVPLNMPGLTYDDTKGFARAVATVLERSEPDRVTATMAKSGRAGKVFVDWSQNDRHKTTVCAYSLRARPQPTVSTPLEWSEIERARDRRAAAVALNFTSEQVLLRVAKHGDLFAQVLTVKQRLPRLT
jgi:bifunctional non-homologous end joining protein LigD